LPKPSRIAVGLSVQASEAIDQCPSPSAGLGPSRNASGGHDLELGPLIPNQLLIGWRATSRSQRRHQPLNDDRLISSKATEASQQRPTQWISQIGTYQPCGWTEQAQASGRAGRYRSVVVGFDSQTR
jgi:hypothetical protein